MSAITQSVFQQYRISSFFPFQSFIQILREKTAGKLSRCYGQVWDDIINSEIYLQHIGMPEAAQTRVVYFPDVMV